MTYEQQEARRKELRAGDPRGVMSGNDIDRIVLREDIDDRIDSLPDHEDMLDLKSLLRDIVGLIR